MGLYGALGYRETQSDTTSSAGTGLISSKKRIEYLLDRCRLDAGATVFHGEENVAIASPCGDKNRQVWIRVSVGIL